MSSAPERVETPRLLLVRIAPAHAEGLAHLLQDPRVAATLTDDGRPPSPEQLACQLQAKLDHWERFGYGLWAAFDGAGGELVGRGGLQQISLPDVHEVEAAWTIVPDRWGQGLATELARASVAVAFDQLKLPRVVAWTTPANRASQRVMAKAGFTFDRNVRHAGTLHPLYVRRRC